MGLIIGSLYFQMATTLADARSRLGATFLLVMFVSFGGAHPGWLQASAVLAQTALAGTCHHVSALTPASAARSHRAPPPGMVQVAVVMVSKGNWLKHRDAGFYPAWTQGLVRDAQGVCHASSLQQLRAPRVQRGAPGHHHSSAPVPAHTRGTPVTRDCMAGHDTQPAAAHAAGGRAVWHHRLLDAGLRCECAGWAVLGDLVPQISPGTPGAMCAMRVRV